MVPSAGQEHFQTVGNEEVTFTHFIQTFGILIEDIGGPWQPFNRTMVRYLCSLNYIAKWLINPKKTNTNSRWANCSSTRTTLTL